MHLVVHFLKFNLFKQLVDKQILYKIEKKEYVFFDDIIISNLDSIQFVYKYINRFREVDS